MDKNKIKLNINLGQIIYSIGWIMIISGLLILIYRLLGMIGLLLIGGFIIGIAGESMMEKGKEK